MQFKKKKKNNEKQNTIGYCSLYTVTHKKPRTNKQEKLMIINPQYHTDQSYQLAALTMKRPRSAFFFFFVSMSKLKEENRK